MCARLGMEGVTDGEETGSDPRKVSQAKPQQFCHYCREEELLAKEELRQKQSVTCLWADTAG